MSQPPPEEDPAILPFPSMDWELDGEETLFNPNYTEIEATNLLAPAPKIPALSAEPRIFAFPNKVRESPPPPRWDKILEALLFVAPEALTLEMIQQSLRGIAAEEIVQTVTAINRRYRQQNRPYSIVQQQDRFSLQLKPSYHHLLDSGQSTRGIKTLSPQAIEVLAMIAYQQPVSRNQIDSLRGSDSGTWIKQLTRLGWIELDDSTNKIESIYCTTREFLRQFQLESLEELPQLGPFQSWQAP